MSGTLPQNNPQATGQPFFADTLPGAAQPGQAGAPQFAKGSKPEFFPDSYDDTAPEKPTGGSTSPLKDFGRQMLDASLSMGAGALGAAGFVANQLGAGHSAAAIQEMRRSLAADISDNLDAMSPEGKQAALASWTNYFSNDPNAPTPSSVGFTRYIGASLASAVPQAALFLVPGGVLGRVVGKIAGTTASTVARVAGTAATGGALQMGDAYNDLVDEIDKAKPEELMQAPFYAKARQDGMDDLSARRYLVTKLAPVMAAEQFAAGAAGAAGVGEMIRGGAPLAAGRGAAARAALGGAEGAATMGAQSGASNAIQQNTQQQAGLRQGFSTRDLALSVASGAVQGTAWGAGAGMLHQGLPRGDEPSEAPSPAPSEAQNSGRQEPRAPMPPAPQPRTPPSPTGAPEVDAALSGQLKPAAAPSPAEAATSAPAGGTPAVSNYMLTSDGLQAVQMGQQGPVGVGPTQGQLSRGYQQGLGLLKEAQDQGMPPAKIAEIQQLLTGIKSQLDSMTSFATRQGGGQGAPGGAVIDVSSSPGATTGAGAPAPSTPPGQGSMARGGQEAAGGGGAAAPAPGQPSRPAAQQVAAPAQPAAQQVAAPAQSSSPIVPTTPEPAAHIQAQISAMMDPNNPRDAVWVAKGSPMPANVPAGVKVARRREGTLLTTDADKAKDFRRGPITDQRLADALNYGQSKPDATAGGSPTVVQATDAHGNVVHEQLTDSANAPAAQQAAQENMPEGGQVRTMSPIDAQEARTQAREEPSPVEDAALQTQQPTPAQAQAGNYRKAPVDLGNLTVRIETPRGAVRVGPVDEKTGQPTWRATAPDHYGYIEGTHGPDGDALDITLGPDAAKATERPVFVIDQLDANSGKFDEPKAFAGYNTVDEAQAAYERSFSDGRAPQRMGAVTEMTWPEFERWAHKPDHTAPVSYQRNLPPTLEAPSPAEQRAARRAAEKARMSAPDAPQQGAAYVSQGESAATAEEQRTAMAEKVAGLREPLTRVLQVRPGQDIGPILNRAIRGVSEAVGRTDGTPDRVAAAIGEWADQQPKGKIPGAATGWRDVGDRAVQLLTGRDTTAERAAGAMRAELEGKGGAAPAARAGNPDEMTAEDRPSEGVQDYESNGRPPSKAMKSTNLADRLGWLEEQVRNDEMTPGEAAAVFGVHGGKTAPEARSFDAWLDHRIAEETAALKPETMLAGVQAQQAKVEKLRAQLRAATEDNRASVRAQLRAAQRAINAEASRGDGSTLVALKEMKTGLARERAEDEHAASTLLTPVQKRALSSLSTLRGQRPAVLKRVTEHAGVDQPSTIPPGRLATDNLMHFLTWRMRQQHRGAELPKLLGELATNKRLLETNPYAADLADRLQRVVPKDTTVRDMDSLLEDAPSLKDAWGDSNVLGIYIAPQEGVRSGIVGLRVTPDFSHTVTLLHEAIHAASNERLNDVFGPRLPSGGEWYTGNQRDPLHRTLWSIRDEVQAAAQEHPELLDTETRDNLNYAVTSPHELVSELMTSPGLQRLAAAHQPDLGFRQRMAALGWGTPETKTLWGTFKGFMRRVLRLPRAFSTSDDSLLDYALRPMRAVVDEGGENYRSGTPLQAEQQVFGARRGTAPRPADPELRSAADPAIDAISGVVASRRAPQDVKNKLWAAVPPAEALRPAVLQAMPLDHIVRRWGALADSNAKASVGGRTIEAAGRGNLLKRYRDASDLASSVSRTVHDAYSDRIMDLVSRVRGLHDGEAQRLGQLMNDATLLQAHLHAADPEANSHLKTPDQQRQLQGLDRAYERLTPAARKLYDDARDYYHETYVAERKASFDSLLRQFTPGATDAQKDALRKAASNRGRLETFLADPDNSEIARAFGTGWQSQSSIVRGMAKLYQRGFVRGDYFPLRRYGNYVVHYGERGGETYGVERFERLVDAEDRRRELLKTHAPEEVSDVLDARRSNLQTMVPDAFVRDLAREVEARGGDGDAATQAAAGLLLQYGARREGARSWMRRNNVQGASADVARNIARDFAAFSSRMGFLAAGPERARALSDLRDHADWLGRYRTGGEQRALSAVVHELELRQPLADDESGMLMGFGRRMSVLGYVKSLMSFSHLVSSTIEAHENSIPLLGARHGTVRATLALTDALRQVAPEFGGRAAALSMKALSRGLRAADWNMNTLLRDRFIAGGAHREGMQRLANALDASNIIDHSQTRELQRIAHGGNIGTKWFQQFQDFVGVAQHVVDATNRWAIAKAGFDLEFRRTHNVAAAVDYAVEQARMSMPNYNYSNKARISTRQGALGGLAPMVTQFKQYGINMYSLLGNLVHESTKGATSQERAEARRALAGIILSHSMMAGAVTTISDPLRYILGAWDWINHIVTGAPAKPHDYSADARSIVADLMGPQLGEVFSRGLPRAVGLDFTHRVGLGNVLEIPELESFDTKGMLKVVGTMMVGASGEDAADMVNSLQHLANGDFEKALIGLAPRIVGDVAKANSLAANGVVDSKGRTIMPASQITGFDVGARALGIQPAKVAEVREGRAAVLQAREELAEQRNQLMQRFISAKGGDRQAVIAEMRGFSRAHPTAPITYDDLMRALKRQQTAATAQQRPGSFGLALPARGAQELTRAGGFANVPH